MRFADPWSAIYPKLIGTPMKRIIDMGYDHLMLLGFDPAFRRVSRYSLKIQDLLDRLFLLNHFSEYTKGEINCIDSKDDTKSSVAPSDKPVFNTIDASTARISVADIVTLSDASR